MTWLTGKCRRRRVGCMCCAADLCSACGRLRCPTLSLRSPAVCSPAAPPRSSRRRCSSRRTRPSLPRASPPASPPPRTPSLSSTSLPCCTTPHPSAWPTLPLAIPSPSPISRSPATAVPSCLSPTTRTSPGYSPCAPFPGATISGEAGRPAPSIMSVFLQTAGGSPWALGTGPSIFFLSTPSVAPPVSTAI